jgi:hypothetical protein
VFAKQIASPTTQASQVLQQSLAALTGGQTITDVTLTGNVRRIAGSDDESGSARFKALASGASRTDFSLPSGPASELSNLTIAPPTGAWSGPDGVAHAIVFHNLLSEPAWFFPAFAIARRLSNSGYIATYVGQETLEGQAVQHISVSQTAPLPNPPSGATYEHLTEIDLFLDSKTLLPATIAFNIHPDNNALLDIPVEVRFSDYRSVNGILVPFHVQKFLNNSLLPDFQAQTVTPNSGLSSAEFSVNVAASLPRRLFSPATAAVGL